MFESIKKMFNKEEKITMTNWVLDTAHTETAFSVRHMGLANVKGNFQTTEGTVALDENNNLVSIDAAIDVASVDTRNADRDNHLRSADFFDAEKFPKIHFVSTSVSKSGEGEYTVKGDLTVKAVTKPISFTAELGGVIDDPYGLKRSGASVEFSIDRRDFDLTWSQALANGSLVVGNKVKISIEAEITQVTE